MEFVTVGGEAPQGFPVAAYNRIHEAFSERFVASHETHDPAMQRSLAWNAVARRSLQAERASAEFARSLRRPATTDERNRQEARLFEFFAAGCSATECFYFALAAMAEMLGPFGVTVTTWTGRKRLSPARVAHAFKKAYPADPLSGLLLEVLKREDYRQFQAVRNVLTHQSHAGRKIFLGGEHDLWDLGVVGLAPLQVDEELTAERFRQLMGWLSELMEGSLTWFKRF